MELPPEVAKALYEALLRPTKDTEGKPGYFIGLHLAWELRRILGESHG